MFLWLLSLRELYAQGVKPSAALRAYDSCKETNLWMQDELYLSGWEIEEISKILTKYEDEVNTLVEKAASERAARYAHQIDKECNQMMDRLVEQMKEKQGVTEELKMQNQMAWVRGMNNIWACAEEIIYKSILYR